MMANCVCRLNFGPILLCIAVTTATVQAFWTAFDIISIDNSKSGIINTDLKVVRFNKTTYAISGTVDLTADLNDDYDCEMKSYLSAQGNSKFTLLPYKVSRDACCTHLESSHWKGVENSLQDCSNLPKRIKDEQFCMTLKKSKYEVKNYSFNYYIIPKHMDTGTYKIEVMLYEKGSAAVSSMTTYKNEICIKYSPKADPYTIFKSAIFSIMK